MGDLELAEEAVQEASLVAMLSWPREGLPDNPRAWLIRTARHKALDALRRELARPGKEARAMCEQGRLGPAAEAYDELSLIVMCCHPAFDLQTRVALTLRSVCGLSTAEIAAVLLLAEPTVAKRLVRARRKIRDTGMTFALPEDWSERIPAVLAVVYLLFTEGHKASVNPQAVRGELCTTAVDLARELHRLLPDDSEGEGLLALLLLTDARRPARIAPDGSPVLLAAQNRALYDRAMIAEGERRLEAALRRGPPGPFQIQAAIAACHSVPEEAVDTDWREIAALYGELLRYDPSPVFEANRAIAVAMAEGPAAGLVVLDAVAHHPRLARWPSFHIARADLLDRLGRREESQSALRAALQLDPSPSERAFIRGRLGVP
ncbi:ECF subfamily RNA polymerase sigma-24 subunit [Intrasporangium oryzae NRRL B-24470]|uniref:ECF subfamily RNA polymerase sigma-24 subunit n=1 Tax=Intrasporangium oryzae NRRL B-24470 TaxID=1386089 RepID=W9G959_9MICO|nr:ECF subfamily RNA polymerase sigma-24 subunit [Intrasporangium oryzae NRRL B-24470]